MLFRPVQTPRPTPVSASLQERLAQRLDAVRAQLSRAAETAGRDTPPSLVAVTKTVGSATTAALADLGCSDFGENRADAFRAKVDALEGLDAPLRWHFIGHLQRNKARRVLERCDVLHSVDSERLAGAVARITSELERPVGAFVEVNLTGEPEKHGLDPGADADELAATLAALAEAPHVRLEGIMAMGPLGRREGARAVEDVFADAAALGASLEAATDGPFGGRRCRLSMGMSGDVQEAVQHGTDLVRVGSSLFSGLDAEELR